MTSKSAEGFNPATKKLLARMSYNDPTPMDVEKTIADIERLEQIHSLPDTRPITLSDREVANRIHDEVYANNPWFRLWQRYGVSSRPEPPSFNPPGR